MPQVNHLVEQTCFVLIVEAMSPIFHHTAES